VRGRKAVQIKGIEQHDFDKLAKTKGSPRERRRFLAFAHLSEGKTFTETAASVRVELRSLMRWVRKFRTEGFKGLKDKPGRGAKPLMPSEHRTAFRQAVLELQEKRIGGRIRGKDILELMKTKYGINPTLKTVYNTLKRADLVWITGRSIHPQADLEAQEAFKKTSQTK
jgi:putative transposase